MVTKQKLATTFGADWHTSTTTETESNQLAASFVDQVRSIRQLVPCTQSQSVSQSPREERNMVIKVNTQAGEGIVSVVGTSSRPYSTTRNCCMQQRLVM